MFELLTARSRDVVQLARDETYRLRHGYIDNGHLLLAILHGGESIAASVLNSFGVTLDDARQKAEELFGRGSHEPGGYIAFTPRARNTFETAWVISTREFRHGYIGPEHFLLGMLQQHFHGQYDHDCAAVQMLKAMDIDLRRLASQLTLEIIGDGVQHAETANEPVVEASSDELVSVTLRVPQAVSEQLDERLDGTIADTRAYYEGIILALLGRRTELS